MKLLCSIFYSTQPLNTNFNARFSISTDLAIKEKENSVKIDNVLTVLAFLAKMVHDYIQIIIFFLEYKKILTRRNRFRVKQIEDLKCCNRTKNHAFI